MTAPKTDSTTIRISVAGAKVAGCRPSRAGAGAAASAKKLARSDWLMCALPQVRSICAVTCAAEGEAEAM